MKESKIIKRTLIFLVSVVVCLGLFFGIKVNAAEARYRIEPSSSDNVYVYYNMFYLSGIPNYDLVVDDNGDKISVAYDSTNSYFIVNNNANYILFPNHLYVIVFQNGINHYIFYEIQKINDNDTIDDVGDVEIIELFTISFSSRVVNYYYVYSQGMQFMFSNLSALNTSQILNSWYLRYYNTFYGRNATQSYNRGYNQGSSDGYTNGYNDGYDDGQEGKTALNKVWETIGGIFTLVGNVMAIELFPNIPIGIFFLIPLVFGAVGFFFWIWKRG